MEKHWVKLFPIYFKISVSDVFIDILNRKLSDYFISISPIKSKLEKVKLIWEAGSVINIKEGVVSTMNAWISAPFGTLPVTIEWTSKSGVIYRQNSSEIDPNDIDFRLFGFEESELIEIIMPVWSLIPNKRIFKEEFYKSTGYTISKKFISKMDKEFTEYFYSKSKLTLSKNICLLPCENLQLLYDGNGFSEVNFNLSVNSFQNVVRVGWKSTSGILIRLDEDFDAESILFRFPEIEYRIIDSQVKSEIIEKLKQINTSYKLNLISVFDTVFITCKLLNGINSDFVKNKIMSFLSENSQLVKLNSRKVMHNYHVEVNEKSLICKIDLGSKGFSFLKSLLLFFSDLNCFEEVMID